MAETWIEWTDATWNPVAGCTVLTAGCTNCYAMRMAARLEAMGTPEVPRPHPEKWETGGLDRQNSSGLCLSSYTENLVETSQGLRQLNVRPFS